MKKVTIIIRREEAKASPVLLEKVQDTDGIEIMYNTEIKSLEGENKLERVILYHKDIGETKAYTPDGIFVFIGMSPNTNFVKEIISLNSEGYIRTTHGFETSVKGIYTAGDSREGSSKQAVTSAGEGAAAALLIREYLREL